MSLWLPAPPSARLDLGDLQACPASFTATKVLVLRAPVLTVCRSPMLERTGLPLLGNVA